MLAPFVPRAASAVALWASAAIAATAAVQPERARDPVDDHGQPVRLGARPARIVSLAPHATELLFAAGAGSRLVAVDPASDHPAGASALPRVAAWPRPDFEALRRASPDLVVLWGAGLRPDLRDAVARIAPVWVSEPSRLDAIPDALRQFGRIAGDPAAASAEADRFAARLAALRAAAPPGPPVRVFYQAWARPLITVSDRDLIGDAIRACGGRNVFGGEAAAARQVDPEALRVARPQLVVLGDGSTADAPGGEPLARWRTRWPGTPPEVVAIPPDLLQRPTPRVLDGVERLCASIRDAARLNDPADPGAGDERRGRTRVSETVRAEGSR